MRLTLVLLAACSTSPSLAIAPALVEVPVPPPPCPFVPATPAALAPRQDVTAVFALDVAGVQRYQCTASGWAVGIPQASVFSGGGRQLAEHWSGPTWISTDDSSSVLAPRSAGVTVTAGAIQWTLHNVTSHGGLTGLLSPIVQIQQLSTAGGAQPTTGCGAGTVGLEVAVPFTARNWFYRVAFQGEVKQRCGG